MLNEHTADDVSATLVTQMTGNINVCLWIEVVWIYNFKFRQPTGMSLIQ